jgi:alanine-synthesizing transaminase
MPRRLAGVSYEIRGRLHEQAAKLEAAGHAVLNLSVGNPGAFGFRAPEPIVADVVARLVEAQAYAPARGLPGPRRAVTRYALAKGLPEIDEDDVYLGNGVSDLILMSLQALLDDGDEVLVPAPDYPLWTAGVGLAGGVAVHYPCDESADWLPDLDAMEGLIGPRTRALVIINPNNPTGAVYPAHTLEAMVELARRHGLVILSDEIYDQILYDGVRHVSTAALAPDLPCLTFNGLSKAYLLAGYRCGWLAVTGPLTMLRQGLDVLTGMRLGANVPGQCALEAALDGPHGPRALVLPGGRLREQRDTAHAALSAIPGVSSTLPAGGLYLFARLDPEMWRTKDDHGLLLDVLLRRRVLFSPGTAFNWPRPDHIRVVTLATSEQLRWAAGQLAEYYAEHVAEPRFDGAETPSGPPRPKPLAYGQLPRAHRAPSLVAAGPCWSP